MKRRDSERDGHSEQLVAGVPAYGNTNSLPTNLNRRVIQMVITKNLTLAQAWGILDLARGDPWRRRRRVQSLNTSIAQLGFRGDAFVPRHRGERRRWVVRGLRCRASWLPHPGEVPGSTSSPRQGGHRGVHRAAEVGSEGDHLRRRPDRRGLSRGASHTPACPEGPEGPGGPRFSPVPTEG